MFEVFEKYLREHTDISDQDVEMIRAGCVSRNMRRWQPILQNGEIWNINCFISSGCLRLYRFDEEGKDHTLRFAINNWWITDVESYNHTKPSHYNIQALVESTVVIWTKAKWLELKALIPALKEFDEYLLLNSFEANQRRIYSLISYSAEERYHEFHQTYPRIFNRVPLHMVASYLGISRETLSRIRKQYAGKANKTPAEN